MVQVFGFCACGTSFEHELTPLFVDSALAFLYMISPVFDVDILVLDQPCMSLYILVHAEPCMSCVHSCT